MILGKLYHKNLKITDLRVVKYDDDNNMSHIPASMYFKDTVMFRTNEVFEHITHKAFMDKYEVMKTEQSYFPADLDIVTDPSNQCKSLTKDDNSYHTIVDGKRPMEYLTLSDWSDDSNEFVKRINDNAYSNSEYITGTYLSEWSYYQNFTTRNVLNKGLTHIYYSFAGMVGSTSLLNDDIGGKSASLNACGARELFQPFFPDLYASIQCKIDSTDTYSQSLSGMVGDLYRLKKFNPDSKIILTIGGWSMTDPFFYLIRDKCSRTKAIDNLYYFMKEFDVFDGAQLDFEFQGGQGITPVVGSQFDGFFYVEFMQELKEMFKTRLDTPTKTHELSVAIGVDRNVFAITPFKEMSEALDYICLMTYDMYGDWSNNVGYQSCMYHSNKTPLYSDLDDHYSIDFIVQRYIDRGVKPEKLAIGACSYAYGWKNIESNSTTDNFFEGTESNSGSDEIITYCSNGLDYTQIVEWYGPNGTRTPNLIRTDEETVAGYVWDKERKLFYSFDTPKVVELKAQYVKDKGIKGLFYWEAKTDRFSDFTIAMNKGLGNTKH